jgi:Fe/S biogenesis protein NfuA
MLLSHHEYNDHVVPELIVTPAAVQKIDRIRAQGGRPDACLRIEITGRRGGRFVYELDLVDPTSATGDDLQVETPGLRILVERASAAHLQGAVIDLDASAIGGALTIDNPNEGWGDPVAARVQEVLDRDINPGVASHGGFVDLLEVRDGAAYVQLSGGCQGCAQVDVTLRQGIEVAIKAAVPEITRVVDRTDHAAGTNPYFQPAKKAS